MKPKSFILNKIAKYLFVFINVVALYLLLKGHNEPGGGFIAGIASALSIIFLTMTLDIKDVKRIIRLEPMNLAILGLILAYGTSLAPVFFNKPFLFHKMFHIYVPILGDLHVGTPMLFDLGVYFVVVGVTSKMILTFSSSVNMQPKFVKEQEEDFAPKGDVPVELDRKDNKGN